MSNDRSPLGPARVWAGAAIFVTCGLVLGLALAGTLRLSPESVAQGVSAPAYQNAATMAPLPGMESPFVAVVDRAAPAVVSIETRRKIGASGGGSSDMEEMYRRWFGQPPGGGGGNMPDTHPQYTPSSGSGSWRGSSTARSGPAP